MCSAQRPNSNTIETVQNTENSPATRCLDLGRLNFGLLMYGDHQVERARKYKRELVLKIKQSMD